MSSDYNILNAGPKLAIAPMDSSLRGVIVQSYLDKLPGQNHEAKMASLKAHATAWRAAGAVAYMPHGFTTMLPQETGEFVQLGGEVGMACIPAFGLDGSDPNGKGTRMAASASTPGVRGVCMDLEGGGEKGTFQQNADFALAMGMAFTKAAPGEVVIHQPWPVPSQHHGFPYGALARYASLWAPQYYYNDWIKYYGRQRYRALLPKFEGEWATLRAQEPGIAAVEMGVSIQGYGWGDIPYDAVHALLDFETTVIWCEPFPEDAVAHAMQARRLLDAAVGLRVNGAWSGRDAVYRFQQKYNKDHGQHLLAEDKIYGMATDKALFG